MIRFQFLRPQLGRSVLSIGLGLRRITADKLLHDTGCVGLSTASFRLSSLGTV